MSNIKWDTESTMVKEAVCILLGWKTAKGNVDRTGKRIARTGWINLTPAARVVLERAGVQG